MKHGYPILITATIVLAGCAGGPPKQPWWASANVAPPPPRQQAGAVYASNDSRGVYSDVKAHQAGDVLTVRINEQANASKQDSTQVNRKGSVNNSASAVLNVPQPGRFDVKAGSQNKFSGSGQAAQSSTFTSTLTAVVTHVLPDGNLVISGRKKVLLDRGPEEIRLRGIVRPSSIGPNNTVSSSQIAQEQLRYTGSGTLHDAQHMGWLQKFLMTIWPF